MIELHREVINAIGRKACSEALGVTYAAVANWAHRDRIAPVHWAAVARLSAASSMPVTVDQLHDQAINKKGKRHENHRA